MNYNPLPRGLRNNNPLNIRHGRSLWRGRRLVQTDPDFVQFESIEMGYRAAFLTLHTYRMRYRRRTIRQIIERWAPSTENNTGIYLLHVCQWSGMHNPDHVLQMRDMPMLVAAMHRQENGLPPNMQQIQAGFQLFLAALQAR